MLSFVSNQVSQCHRLTVASDKKGVSSCLLWELDELAADPECGWLLFEGSAAGSKPFIAGLKGVGAEKWGMVLNLGCQSASQLRSLWSYGRHDQQWRGLAAKCRPIA